MEYTFFRNKSLAHAQTNMLVYIPLNTTMEAFLKYVSPLIINLQHQQHVVNCNPKSILNITLVLTLTISADSKPSLS